MLLSPLDLLLVYLQALGACIGAITAVWSELAYVKAMRDGKIDHAERTHLRIIGHGLRYGMMLLLIASLGLVVVAYLENATLQPALSSSYWILIVLTLLILTVSEALARKRLPFALASASLFTAWWFLVYLSSGLLPLTFGAAVMSFIIAVAIFYAIFYYARLVVLA